MLRKISIIATLLLTGLSLAGFAFPASSMAEEETGNPWLLWLLVVVILVAFVVFMVWWWRRGGDEEVAVRSATDEAAADEGVAPPPPEPDDLKAIEGIGPKISSVFQAAGITTFAQLAGASTGQLEQILEEADPSLLRLANPATWPEQAKLAAEGRWEELGKLQDELHGGQRQ